MNVDGNGNGPYFCGGKFPWIFTAVDLPQTVRRPIRYAIPLRYSTTADNILKDNCRQYLSDFQSAVNGVLGFFIFQRLVSSFP